MEQISSHNNFRTSETYQRQPQFTPARNLEANTASQSAKASEAKPADFASMFNDDSLLKLQSNLEAIAQMAERSLKHIDS